MALEPVTKVSDAEAARELKEGYQKLKTEVQKVIVGQEDVIRQILVAIFCRGHCLMVGVPGLAKTLLVNTLADAFHLNFKRIQFTPDLMPSDITGTDMVQENPQTGKREFVFRKGPIFVNILLADEINRTPPKTQAALLEAMQERTVSVGNDTYALPKPFFVLATQNPIEQEGTYQLPEAQLDRFMFLVKVDYPDEKELITVLERTTGNQSAKANPVFNGDDIIRFQQLTRNVPVPEHVLAYAVHLVQATWIKKPEGIDICKKYLSWGAGPRAAQQLIMGAKANCLLEGRFAATNEDVDAVAHSVLRHRIVLNFHAEAEGITPEIVIDEILKKVPKHGSNKVKPV